MALRIEGSTEAEVNVAIPIYTSVKSLAYRKSIKFNPTVPKRMSELETEVYYSDQRMMEKILVIIVIIKVILLIVDLNNVSDL